MKREKSQSIEPISEERLEATLQKFLAARDRPPTFDPTEALRQNLQWYAQDKARRERRQAIQNAQCDLQRMSLAQQREWIEQEKDSDLVSSVWRHLHPMLLVEIINRAEEEALQRTAEAEKLPKKKPLSNAEEFLVSVLSQGPRRVSELVAEAAKAGIRERTLHRAKAKLAIRSVRMGFATGGYFVWSLPDDSKIAPGTPEPLAQAPSEVTGEDREALLLWIDEGNPNCEGL